VRIAECGVRKKREGRKVRRKEGRKDETREQVKTDAGTR
jgi:hypothetical protein